MKLYRIKELNFSDEKDSYFAYQGEQEIELKLNHGFTVAREMLEYLASAHDFTTYVFVSYDKEELTYCFASSSKLVEETHDKCMPNCTCKMVEAPEILKLVEKDGNIILKGSASPLVLNERENGLIDELVRTFPKESWVIKVKLEKEPDPNEKIGKLEEKINRLSQISTKSKSEQENIVKSMWKSLIGGDNYSYQETDISAQQLLEMYKNHLYTLRTQGTIYKSVTYHIFSSPTISEAIKAKILSFSQRSGSFTIHKLKEVKEDNSKAYLNFTTSNLVASVLSLPSSCVPGIKINKMVQFGVDLSVSQGQGTTLLLGKLFQHHQTDLPVVMDINDLTKHVCVAGVTGSGKTSTIKSILLKVYEHKKPFLIIEPAKIEYQFLQLKVECLNRYTLGIEGEHSFKINPFEFPDGIHIQTHLDHLKAVFVAAFPMYGPMPYILETALYNIYRRCGWDFVSSINIYEGQLDRGNLFPILEDLYNAIDEATLAVGYSADLSNDVRGALKVRVGSLLNGAKGIMLNSKETNSIKNLLSVPTVLELEAIGDDQEKVFLMGLLLISIYEYYTSLGNFSDSIKNVMVIEEAHRLLQNVAAVNNNEIADIKGKALENFNNILSEIRAYGQGIVIADQIPTKLSPDVIKNTNLKIIHRLFSKDDREQMGHSIGLDDDQLKEIIRLRQGQAVVFHSQIDEPMKVQVVVPNDVLAEGKQQMVRKQSSGLNVEKFVVQVDWLRQTAFDLINTFILFPELEKDINNQLISKISEFLPEQSPVPNPINIWQNVVRSYVKEKSISQHINYDEEQKFFSTLNDSREPLNVLKRFLEIRLVPNVQPHKMAHLSRSFQGYGILRQLIKTNENLDSLYVKYAENFKHNSLPVVEQSLATSEISKHVWISLLNSEQKASLCSSLVIFSFYFNYNILENYFDIQDAFIASDKLKRLKYSNINCEKINQLKEINNSIVNFNREIAHLNSGLEKNAIILSDTLANIANEKAVKEIAVSSESSIEQTPKFLALFAVSIFISILSLVVVLLKH